MDSAFLAIEDPSNLTHVGMVGMFSGGGLTAGGRVDQGQYLATLGSALEQLPEWRLKLARVPVFGRRVLVPDPSFALERHVRFVHLEGGDLEGVEALVSEFYSRMLRRDRPLWEQLIIDGLAGGGFAVVSKVHHAMVDGVAGLGALQALLSSEPVAPASQTEPSPFVSRGSELPELAPFTRLELLKQELALRSALPSLLWRQVRAATSAPRGNGSAPRKSLAEAASAAVSAVKPTSRCVLNAQPVGPHRGFRGVTLSLEAAKAVRRAAGCKLNDVVLATVGGALQSYLSARSAEDGSGAPETLRVMVPVSLHPSGHKPDAHDTVGNQISLMIVEVPLAAAGPRDRLSRLATESRAVKRRDQSGALALGQTLAEWTFAPLIPWVVRLVMSRTPYHLAVTNVAGPTEALYLCDSRLLAAYPMVPVYGNQALGVALVSYEAGLYVGLSADADHIRDLEALAEAVELAFDELCRAYFPLGVDREVPSA